MVGETAGKIVDALQHAAAEAVQSGKELVVGTVQMGKDTAKAIWHSPPLVIPIKMGVGKRMQIKEIQIPPGMILAGAALLGAYLLARKWGIRPFDWVWDRIDVAVTKPPDEVQGGPVGPPPRVVSGPAPTVGADGEELTEDEKRRINEEKNAAGLAAQERKADPSAVLYGYIRAKEKQDSAWTVYQNRASSSEQQAALNILMMSHYYAGQYIGELELKDYVIARGYPKDEVEKNWSVSAAYQLLVKDSKGELDPPLSWVEVF